MPVVVYMDSSKKNNNSKGLALSMAASGTEDLGTLQRRFGYVAERVRKAEELLEPREIARMSAVELEDFRIDSGGMLLWFSQQNTATMIIGGNSTHDTGMDRYTTANMTVRGLTCSNPFRVEVHAANGKYTASTPDFYK